MPEDTFYLKVEAAPEKFEAWLGEVSIPSVYYKRHLPNQKDIMRCLDVRLRKIQSDEGGFTHFLVYGKCHINFFVSHSRPFYESRENEIPLGYIKFLNSGDNCLCVIGCRNEDKWLGVFEQLFMRLRTEYRPNEPGLQMSDEKNIVLETIKDYKEKTVLGSNEPLGSLIQPELVKEDRAEEQQINNRKLKSVISQTTTEIKLPQTEQALKRWKKAYALILKAYQEYGRDFNSGRTKKPTPTVDDLRDVLIPLYKKRPSDRQVEKIMAAGKAGLLK